MIPHIARRYLPVLLLAVSVLAVLLAPRAAWASQERDERTLGVYVTSLHDFDPADDSFGIDFWVWSVDAPGNDQLKKLEFVNAKQLDIRLERTNRRGSEEWSRSKVRATVLHDWDLTNFPFDRQTLTVDLGISGPDATGYLVDRAGSGIAKNIAPEGWRITSFDIERRAVEEATDLGDPSASDGSSQQHVFVSLGLERESIVGFLKLIAGVYAAILIALLSFLMVPEAPPVFAGRMTVLVGSMFATVVNLQVSNNVLGSPGEVSLIDKIHILALAYIFCAALMAIVSRMGYDAGYAELAHRRDIASLLVFGVSFVIINAVLISLAYVAG